MQRAMAVPMAANLAGGQAWGSGGSHKPAMAVRFRRPLPKLVQAARLMVKRAVKREI